MNELRRQLLDDSDAPDDLSPELRFLAARQAALAGLFVDHAELYAHLHARLEEQGPSRQLEDVALDAAGNLGTVMQSLRSREDLLAVLEHAPDVAAPPMSGIDQLFFSLLLLAGPATEDELLACLPPTDLDGLMTAEKTRNWLASMNVDEPLSDDEQ
jgi:hypothetical protein